jgi:hypothetical protein
MDVNFNLPKNSFNINHFCFFSVRMIIWYGFDVIIFYERKVNMKAVPIALFIVSIILSAGSTSLADTVADNQSLYAEPGEAILALEYSDERSVANEVQSPSIRWYKRKNNTKLNGVALVIHGLNTRPDKMESIIAKLNDFGIDCLNLSLRGHGENIV